MKVRYSAQRLAYQSPIGLDALEDPVAQQRRADLVQRPGAQREQAVQVAQDPDVPRGLHRAAGHAALQRGEDPVVGVVQRGAVGGEQQHPEPDEDQHDEVHHAVDGDQPQHDLVVQRLATRGHDDLGPVGRVRSGGIARAAGAGTQVSQRRQRCQRTSPWSWTQMASCGRAGPASRPTSTCPETPQVISSQSRWRRRRGCWVPGGCLRCAISSQDVDGSRHDEPDRHQRGRSTGWS